MSKCQIIWEKRWDGPILAPEACLHEGPDALTINQRLEPNSRGALIEDTRTKAMEAANCWFETDQAKELLEKIDAYERLSDRFSGEVTEAAAAFSEAASEAQDALDNLRSDAVDAAAFAHSSERHSEEWWMAWEDAEADAPPVKQILADARRSHAGDTYLERFAA